MYLLICCQECLFFYQTLHACLNARPLKLMEVSTFQNLPSKITQSWAVEKRVGRRREQAENVRWDGVSGHIRIMVQVSVWFSGRWMAVVDNALADFTLLWYVTHQLSSMDFKIEVKRLKRLMHKTSHTVSGIFFWTIQIRGKLGSWNNSANHSNLCILPRYIEKMRWKLFDAFYLLKYLVTYLL